MKLYYSLLLLLCLNTAHAGNTAAWTGRQNVSHDMNGYVSYSCEYNLLGKLVWITTTGVCPSRLDFI